MKKTVIAIMALFLIGCSFSIVTYNIAAASIASDTCTKSYVDTTGSGIPNREVNTCIISAKSTNNTVVNKMNISIKTANGELISSSSNVRLDSIEGLNGWSLTDNGSGNYLLRKSTALVNDTEEVLKLVYSVDITYDKDCSLVYTPSFSQDIYKCSVNNNIYYNTNGEVVTKEEYENECNPKCEIKDDKYYNNSGQEVDKTTYENECNPKCEIKDDKYYNNSGQEVDKTTYENECNPKCEIKDDKYFNNSGQEVDKTTYENECNPKCEIKDDKYYDDDGKEITEEEFNRLCPKEEPKKCTEDGTNYYDKNGNKVSKETYLESCGLVENPKTGNPISYIGLGIGGLTAGAIYFYTKKNKIYKL